MAYKSSSISETRQDRTKVTFVTIEGQEEVQCALSIVPKSMTLDNIIGHSIFDVGTITIPVYLLIPHMTSYLLPCHGEIKIIISYFLCFRFVNKQLKKFIVVKYILWIFYQNSELAECIEKNYGADCSSTNCRIGHNADCDSMYCIQYVAAKHWALLTLDIPTLHCSVHNS